MLHEFITLHREEIIRRCREKVAARSVPPPTASEIEHGVPLFLDQLGDALRLGESVEMPGPMLTLPQAARFWRTYRRSGCPRCT